MRRKHTAGKHLRTVLWWTNIFTPPLFLSLSEQFMLSVHLWLRIVGISVYFVLHRKGSATEDRRQWSNPDTSLSCVSWMPCFRPWASQTESRTNRKYKQRQIFYILLYNSSSDTACRWKQTLSDVFLWASESEVSQVSWGELTADRYCTLCRVCRVFCFISLQQLHILFHPFVSVKDAAEQQSQTVRLIWTDRSFRDLCLLLGIVELHGIMSRLLNIINRPLLVDERLASWANRAKLTELS